MVWRRWKSDIGDEVRLNPKCEEAYQYKKRAEQGKDEQEEKMNLAIADALESLEYDKIKTNKIREK